VLWLAGPFGGDVGDDAPALVVAVGAGSHLHRVPESPSDIALALICAVRLEAQQFPRHGALVKAALRSKRLEGVWPFSVALGDLVQYCSDALDYGDPACLGFQKLTVHVPLSEKRRVIFAHQKLGI
jgi:hypothetical protein